MTLGKTFRYTHRLTHTHKHTHTLIIRLSAPARHMHRTQKLGNVAGGEMFLQTQLDDRNDLSFQDTNVFK